MGSVFGSSSVIARPKPTSRRQAQYFKAKKTTDRKVVKHEQNIQIQARNWFVATFPGEHFISDTGAGAFNSEYEKNTHNQQQSHKQEPDIKILAARRGYHGLMIELKADGVNLRMGRNGTKIRIRKDKRGRIVERDYKIRLKGDWASLHIEQQAAILDDYMHKGYYGHFAVGLEAFKKICCWYFDKPYIEDLSMF